MERPFDRVVCAVDGSDEAVEAAIQGCRMAPGAAVTLLHVIDSLDAPAEPGERPAWYEGRRRRADEILSAARCRLTGACGPGPSGGPGAAGGAGSAKGAGVSMESAVETAMVEGERPAVLRAATEGEPATLLTMGSGEEEEMQAPPPLPPPSVDRLTWRVLRTVECSVLVGRRAAGPPPLRITVGVDGSPAAAAAYRVAEAIAAVSGARVRAVTAMKGHRPDLVALRSGDSPVAVDQLEWEQADVALIEEGRDCDLLVVGRRGHHGIRDVGRVSAAVAAYSPVSVLVVNRR